MVAYEEMDECIFFPPEDVLVVRDDDLNIIAYGVWIPEGEDEDA